MEKKLDFKRSSNHMNLWNNKTLKSKKKLPNLANLTERHFSRKSRATYLNPDPEVVPSDTKRTVRRLLDVSGTVGAWFPQAVTINGESGSYPL